MDIDEVYLLLCKTKRGVRRGGYLLALVRDVAIQVYSTVPSDNYNTHT